jgi:hypothetical protein
MKRLPESSRVLLGRLRAPGFAGVLGGVENKLARRGRHHVEQ